MLRPTIRWALVALCAGLTACPDGGTTVGPLAFGIANPGALPFAVVGKSYSATLGALGGRPPYSFALADGDLPPGLVLTSAGAISGTPSLLGDYAFEIEAVDSQSPPQSARAEFALLVLDPDPLAISTTSLPAGLVGRLFGVSIVPSGGIAPLAWAVTAGALPPGLALDASNGNLEGTPTAEGTYSFEITLSDAQTPPETASRTFTLVVYPVGARFAFVAQATGGLSLMTSDAASGRMRHRHHLPWGTGTRWCALTPSGRFAYTVGPADGGVLIYGVEQNGWLRAINVHATPTPQAVAVHPLLDVVYVTNGSAGTLSYFGIQWTGELTLLGAVLTGSEPRGLMIDAAGGFLYVANSGSDDVGIFSLDANGVPTAVGTVAAGDSPQMIALHPAGAYAYAVNAGSDNVSMYTVGAGTLVPNGSIAAGSGSCFVSVHPEGAFAYVTNAGEDTISRYTIASGVLVPAGTTPTGVEPRCIQVAPGGSFASCVNSGSHEVWTFAVESDGVLTLIEEVRARETPTFVTFLGGSPPDPHATHVFVSNDEDDTVSRFSVDRPTGALTLLGTTSTPDSPHPGDLDLATHALWLPNQGSDSVARYSVDGAGALTLQTTTAVGAGPHHLVRGTHNRDVFVVNRGAGSVTRFWASLDGSLGVPSTFSVGTDPRMVAFDPTGRFGYVPNYGSDTLSVFSTKDLAAVGAPVATPDEPIAVAVEPRGKFLYLNAYGIAESIVAYAIDPVTGGLTSIQTLAATGGPTGIAIHPSGRWLYQLREDADKISRYEISQTTGMLTFLGQTDTRDKPYAMRLDPSGAFLYLTHGGEASIGMYAVDAASGDLSPPILSPTGRSPNGVMFRTVLD